MQNFASCDFKTRLGSEIWLLVHSIRWSRELHLTAETFSRFDLKQENQFPEVVSDVRFVHSKMNLHLLFSEWASCYFQH